MLDGFQDGTFWLTILRKPDGFREVLKNFDPEKVSRFGEADIVKLLANAGIVYSRAKNGAAVKQAYEVAHSRFSFLFLSLVLQYFDRSREKS